MLPDAVCVRQRGAGIELAGRMSPLRGNHTRLMRWARPTGPTIPVAPNYRMAGEHTGERPLKIAARSGLLAGACLLPTKRSFRVIWRATVSRCRFTRTHISLRRSRPSLQTFLARLRVNLRERPRWIGGEGPRADCAREVLRPRRRGSRRREPLRDLIYEAARKLRGDKSLESARKPAICWSASKTIVRQSLAARHAAEGRGEFRAAEFRARHTYAVKWGMGFFERKFDRVDRSASGAVIYDYQLNARAFRWRRFITG